MSDEVEEFADDGMTDEQYRAEVIGILRAYQMRQLKLHMIGPLISVVLHIVILGGMSVIAVGGSKGVPKQYVVQTIELPVKEIEEELIEELDEMEFEDVPVEEAPEVEVAEVPQAETNDAISDSDAVSDTFEDMPGSTDDFASTDMMIDVMETSNTPLKLDGLYGARGSASRQQSVQRYGGTRAGQDAVEKALAWLAKVQKPDGSWANNPAHTGMALLVFLAHGETPLSEKYGTTVQKAMQWQAGKIMALPNDGTFGQRSYAYGIAVYSLAEAYGMTKIPFLKAAMEKGLDRIIRGQQPGGGFDYNYAKGERWDLSVAGWQFQALKAGFAAGSDNPKLHDAIDKSVKFLKETAYKNKKFGYASPGSGGNMTGVGTVALQLLGAKDSTEARGGAETIAKERLEIYKSFLAGKKDWKKDAGHSIYGWYYDTQAMFNKQDKDWREWNKVFERVLVKAQHPDGYWAVEKAHGMNDDNDDGRILSTTWCVLQLEVYYRYLPTFDIKKMDKSRSVNSLDEVDTGLIIE